MALRQRTATRSDAVRARRGQPGRKKPVTTRRSTSASRVAPPMVARVSMARPPAHTRTRKEARRRYNLSINTAGAEMRLPALPALHFGWRLISGLIIASLVAGIYAFTSLPRFTVAGVEVEGIQRLSGLEINSVLNVTGASIFSIEPDVLVRELQAKFPELVGVSVQVSFPNRVIVQSGERVPVLAWQQGGVLFWVDRDGVAFPPRGQVAGLVQVQAIAALPQPSAGQDTERVLVSPEVVVAILSLNERAPEGTTLLFDLLHGFGWVDPRGWQVYFGPNPTDIPERLAVYERILASLEEKGIRPILVSVEYLHAPYYRIAPPSEEP